jgi:hypothetical protein
MNSTEDIVKTYLQCHSVQEMSLQLKYFILLRNLNELDFTSRHALNFIHREYFEMNTYTYQDFIDTILLAKELHGV